jgi:predicted NBD/HSP70 family sugar kinase
MIAKKYIAFDIGATKILKAVVKVRGIRFEFLETEEERNPKKEEKIRKIVSAYCEEARKKYWTKKVAFSAACVVDQKKKIVIGGKHCYGTDTFDLKFLEKNGLGVRIENDGRCFALGEYYFGKGGGAKSIFAMTLGTNVGGGFILDGKNFRGAHNSGMEISYINYFREGKWHDWDDICTGKGIEDSYQKLSGARIPAKNVFELASKKDPRAKKIISEATPILGMGIANILNIIDPEIVIFGGSISKQKEYIKSAIKIARKNAMNKKANYKFAISSLGNKANLLGAAALYASE